MSINMSARGCNAQGRNEETKRDETQESLAEFPRMMMFGWIGSDRSHVEMGEMRAAAGVEASGDALCSLWHHSALHGATLHCTLDRTGSGGSLTRTANQI